MISCFKGSATDDWKTDFENTHAVSYTSISDISEGGPKISKIVESFKQYNVFKYAAYRTAFKMRMLQKASKLHLIDLAVISSILKECNLESQSLEKTISPEEAANTICTLYSEAGKSIGFAEDPNVMAHLFCALLHNAFVEDENAILLVQMKITLTLFSAAKLSEKHKYMFYHCSTDGFMNKTGLQILLKTLSKLAEVVGEQVTFGSHLVPMAVQNCLKFCNGNISEKRFRKWMTLDPQTLVWLSTLHRIAIGETTEHFINCDYCQASPVIGLRYKCLQCMNYNLCQNCFLRGLTSKGHKEGHYVQEFCQPASIWQETKATFNAVKNKLPFAKNPSKAYLSFEEESLCDSSAVISNPSVRKSIQGNCSLRKSTSTYLFRELSSIVAHLEEERKQILEGGNVKENEAGNQTYSSKSSKCQLENRNSLKNFDLQFGLQLDRLKDLLKAIKVPDATKKETGIVSPVPHVPFHRKENYFESTPMNSAILPLQSKENLPQFSSLASNNSRRALEKRRNKSSSYSKSLNSFGKENWTFSSTYNVTESQDENVSLELTEILNNSSPKNLSAKLSELNGDLSKLSPLYVCSSIDLEEVTARSDALSPGPMSVKSLGSHHSRLCKSTFTINEDGNLEIMEQELHAMLQRLEELMPQVSFLANESQVEKEKVLSALSDMEEAVQKLSHLSIEVSTGSTDL